MNNSIIAGKGETDTHPLSVCMPVCLLVISYLCVWGVYAGAIVMQLNRIHVQLLFSRAIFGVLLVTGG